MQHLFKSIFKVYYLRNNLLEQINPQWDCIVSKNTYFQHILIENRKRQENKFLNSKTIWQYGKYMAISIHSPCRDGHVSKTRGET